MHDARHLGSKDPRHAPRTVLATALWSFCVSTGLLACSNEPELADEQNTSATTETSTHSTGSDPSISDTSNSADPDDTVETSETADSLDPSTDDDGSDTSESDTETELSLDEQIAALLAAQEVPVVPLERPDPPPQELFDLGEALFYDPILSGNKDVACATCHHPSLGTSDGINLSLGTGATEIGPPRQDNDHRDYIARHSPTLYNVGDPSVINLFWDGRVEQLPDGSLRTPAGDQLPEGLDGVLAAQALFPLLDRAEMRGLQGDMTILGENNELAEFDDEARPEIWAAIMHRLGGYEAYQDLFAAAFPDLAFEDVTIAQVANAIAAYQREAFSFPDSRWDAYLTGDLDALTEDEKWGAFHFYNDNPTSGLCSTCHSGPMFTDQKFHDTGIPQVGPGHANSQPFDLGRALVTGDDDDRFRFRTPTVRNFSTSPPFMHNGSFANLDAILRHYRAPATSVSSYDVAQLHPDLRDTLQNDEDHMQERRETLSELISQNVGFGALVNLGLFLEALTDPAVEDIEDLRPASVPSGLDVP